MRLLTVKVTAPPELLVAVGGLRLEVVDHELAARAGVLVLQVDDGGGERRAGLEGLVLAATAPRRQGTLPCAVVLDGGEREGLLDLLIGRAADAGPGPWRRRSRSS